MKFVLSDKQERAKRPPRIMYEEKDVKEFIKLLKEGTTMGMIDDYGKPMGRLIIISEHQLHKLAGEDLI